MKKGKIIIAVFLIISILGIAYLYDSRQREANMNFFLNVIGTLNDSYEGGRLVERLEEKEISAFEFCYEFKESISSAKYRMERWKSDKNTLRRDVGKGMLGGIDDLIIAAEECINMARESERKKYEEHLALFKIKLRKGRIAILAANIILIGSSAVPDKYSGGLRLSKSQKKELKDTIEFYFKKDFAEHKIDPERTSISIEAYPTEIIAVVGIYRYLSE